MNPTLALAAALLFSDNFAQLDGLVTNEYAYQHQSDTGTLVSKDWETPSGSLFAQEGVGTTGVPDDTPANARSTNGTHSAVFRLLTARGDFGDVAVSFDLLNEALTAGATTPAVPWDGCHVVARYQGEGRFYYASVDRRDETAVIKKKAGDTYYDLTPAVPAAVPYRLWQKVRVEVKDEPDGTVSIALYRDGRLLARGVDAGVVGGPPLRGVGKVGLRGDNARLKFGHFRVETLAPPAAAAAPPPSAGPAISGPAAISVSASSATIIWVTDDDSYDRVEYGPTSSYGLETPWSGDVARAHNVALYGLNAATIYHYKIWARSRAGAQSSTGDLAFTTAAQADPVPPTVVIVSPSNGQTISGSVPLVCAANDNIGVAGVTWEIDGASAADLTQAPFTYIWPASNSPNGPHTIRAIARDAAGNRAVSPAVTVKITGGR